MSLREEGHEGGRRAGAKVGNLIENMQREFSYCRELYPTLGDADLGVALRDYDRICLAGERIDPAREPNANWTLTQHAAVIAGPRRRALYRSLRDFRSGRPITAYTPYLALGDGVRMEPEWQADIEAGRCELAPERAG